MKRLLTRNELRDILIKKKLGLSNKVIAEDYGVNTHTIYSIVNNRYKEGGNRYLTIKALKEEIDSEDFTMEIKTSVVIKPKGV